MYLHLHLLIQNIHINTNKYIYKYKYTYTYIKKFLAVVGRLALHRPKPVLKTWGGQRSLLSRYLLKMSKPN